MGLYKENPKNFNIINHQGGYVLAFLPILNGIISVLEAIWGVFSTIL